MGKESSCKRRAGRCLRLQGIERWKVSRPSRRFRSHDSPDRQGFPIAKPRRNRETCYRNARHHTASEHLLGPVDVDTKPPTAGGSADHGTNMEPAGKRRKNAWDSGSIQLDVGICRGYARLLWTGDTKVKQILEKANLLAYPPTDRFPSRTEGSFFRKVPDTCMPWKFGSVTSKRVEDASVMGFDPLNEDRWKVLRWLKRRNPQISTSDLAYLMDIDAYDAESEKDAQDLAWE